MRRFFVPPEGFSENTVTLTGPDVNHIRTVLRMKPGDRIGVVDGAGFLYEAELREIGKESIHGIILSRSPFQTESPVEIRLGQALLKGSAMDDVVRKATELGVNAIFSVITRRCVAKPDKNTSASKSGRLQRIAEEASKQCGRARIPEVHGSVLSLEEFCREASHCSLKLVFWEEEAAQRLADVASPEKVTSIACVAGPEGGLTVEEIALLKEKGFQTVTLGPRVLKADSASLVILSLLQHRWGDL